MEMKKWFVTGLIFLGPFTVSAALRAEGGMSGGGGKGVVCRNAQGLITSVETLDLFESKALYQVQPRSFSQPWEKVIQTLKSELSKAMSQPEIHLFPLLDRAQRIVRWVGPEVQLVPVEDAALVAVPTQCSLEQLAVYVDDSLLLIQRDLWEKMDASNKAALFLHEAIYRLDRYDGAKDSRRTRRLVGMALAGFPFEAVDSDRPRGSRVCSTLDGSYAFHVFPQGPASENRSVLQFHRYAGHWVFGKTTVVFPMSWDHPCQVPTGQTRFACTGGDVNSQTETGEHLAFAAEQETTNGITEFKAFLISDGGKRHEIENSCFF